MGIAISAITGLDIYPLSERRGGSLSGPGNLKMDVAAPEAPKVEVFSRSRKNNFIKLA
jgi:hypothetical protein